MITYSHSIIEPIFSKPLESSCSYSVKSRQICCLYLEHTKQEGALNLEQVSRSQESMLCRQVTQTLTYSLWTDPDKPGRALLIGSTSAFGQTKLPKLSVAGLP